MGFSASTLFQAWVQGLRIKYLSFKGRAQAMAYATVIGDWTIDWMTAALLERMPLQASATAVGLIASDRQLDVVPNEATAAVAARCTQWIKLGKFASSPLGMLLGLHFAGFDNAVIVQQNGMAYQLQLPLPTIIPGQNWDPTPNLIRTPTAALDVALEPVAPSTHVIPSSTSWWNFDGGGCSLTDWCSRFAVLFPGPLPSSFVTWGTATFTGAENGSSVPWPMAVWNNPFSDTTYHAKPSPPTITDGGGGVITWVDGSSKTTTSVRVASTAAFHGTVDVLAWQNGTANPMADPHPSDLLRLQNVIKKWRPARAICVGVFVCTQGKFMDWPVGTMDQQMPANGTATIVQLPGSY